MIRLYFHGHKLARYEGFDATIWDDGGRKQINDRHGHRLVEALSRRYGATLTVDQVSLRAARGEIGLGLAIAKRLIDSSGGAITLSKPLSGGLLATIWLPKSFA